MSRRNALGLVLAAICVCLPVACLRVSAMQDIVVQAPHMPHMPHVGHVSPEPPVPPAVVEVSSSPGEINLEGTWKFREDVTVDGYDRGWASPDFNDSSWSNIKVPGDWESQGFTQVNPAWSQSDDLHQPYTGYAWYRKTVIIPAEWKGKTLILQLGEIDDLDWTRVNGRWIGETSDRSGWPSAKPRAYTIPSEIVRWGRPNVIAVRVLDYRGLGGMRTGPVKIITTDMVGSPAVTTPNNDAVKIGGGVTIQASQTVKDAVAVGGSVRVYGHVQGDAVSVGGTVHVYPGGSVAGDAVGVGGGVIQDDGASIGGQKTSIGMAPWGDGDNSWLWKSCVPFSGAFGGSFGGVVFSIVIGFLKNIFLTLLAMLIVALFLLRTETVAHTIVEKPGWSILYGILALVLAVPVALFLLVTCIGIPLIVVEIGIFVVAKFLGFAGLSLAIGWKLGDAVQKPISSPLIAVLIGGLALSVLGLVPFLGSSVDWVLRLFGLGAVFITGFGASTDWIWNRRGIASPPQSPPPPSPQPPAG
jgi:hypothetical protein